MAPQFVAELSGLTILSMPLGPREVLTTSATARDEKHRLAKVEEKGGEGFDLPFAAMMLVCLMSLDFSESIFFDSAPWFADI